MNDSTIGDIKFCLEYNSDTGLITWRNKYSSASRVVIGDKAGFISKEGYNVIGLGGSSYKGHRLAHLLYYGDWPKGQIDHINGVRDDNRIENLRDIGPKENARNAKLSVNNKSGCHGVNWHSAAGKWQARICENSHRVVLGYFEDLEEAISCRKLAEVEYGYHKNHGREV